MPMSALVESRHLNEDQMEIAEIIGIAALGAAIAEHEKNSSNTPSSAVQQLVEAFISTNNPAKRQKKIAEIKARSGELNAMLAENSELITAEIEQALYRAATGYTV
ncbi:MAG: hypothetical protein ACI4Q4_02475, partial [Oscillospiraceae bacterium]